jgi:hypothetical protein
MVHVMSCIRQQSLRLTFGYSVFADCRTGGFNHILRD